MNLILVSRLGFRTRDSRFDDGGTLAHEGARHQGHGAKAGEQDGHASEAKSVGRKHRDLGGPVVGDCGEVDEELDGVLAEAAGFVFAAQVLCHEVQEDAAAGRDADANAQGAEEGDHGCGEHRVGVVGVGLDDVVQDVHEDAVAQAAEDEDYAQACLAEPH